MNASVSPIYVGAMIVVVAAVTALLRFLPFWAFGGRRPVPRAVATVSNALPPAVMGLLIVYCLRNLSFARTLTLHFGTAALTVPEIAPAPVHCGGRGAAGVAQKHRAQRVRGHPALYAADPAGIKNAPSEQDRAARFLPCRHFGADMACNLRAGMIYSK